jgi:CubicO group peptidase (beta-lactamase class C family)
MDDSLTLMRGFPPALDRQVTIANMQEAPYSRWAFRNMRRLLPSAQVWRGTGPVTELPVAPVDLGDIAFEDKEGRTLSVKQHLDEGYTDGFVVLHEGAIVAERYGDGVEAHEPHLLMSVTKSFAGSLAGILVERGLMSPDDLVTDIVPEVKGSAYDGARLRHVLDMTVGMDFNEDYEDPESDVGLLDVAAGWRPYREGAPDGLRAYIATMRPAGEHGTTFHYVSTNTDLLGWILERVAGTDFASLLSAEIWQPMGAEFDAYITLDRYGAPQTDGGLCVTTRDLARFGLMHQRGGVLNGRRIVPESWIRDFRENGDAAAWDRGNFAEMMPGCHYRSKWYTDLKDDHHPFMGIGVHGQMVFIDPAASVVVARHSSHPRPVEEKFFDDMERAFKAIAHAFGD